jgi:hypothetical protein
VDHGHGFCWVAALALSVCACSSGGPGAPVESSNVGTPGAASQAAKTSSIARGLATPIERAGSPVLPEDNAPEHAGSCDPYAGPETAHLSALLGHQLVSRRGAMTDSHESCSLFGDGIRVRVVTVLSSATEDSARLKCHALAGAGAQFVPGVGSMSWQSPLGVYTAQQGQCLWTQVYQNGALDLVASRTVAQDAARRRALQALPPSEQ